MMTPGEKSSTQDEVFKYSIIVITLIITVWAMWYIYAQMGKVKAQVIYERRKARLEKLHHSENPQFTLYPRQMKTVELYDDMLSHSTVALAPLPTRPFNPGGIPEGQEWDERGNAIGWPDSSLHATNHAIKPTVREGRIALTQGGDLATRRHRDAPHPARHRIHGGEVLVNPFDPHQHLRTRSLSGFHKDVTADNSDALQTAATNY